MSELRDVADAINEQTPRPKCVLHRERPSVVNLDGDELCQECADAWVRAEGEWIAEQEDPMLWEQSGDPSRNP